MAISAVEICNLALFNVGQATVIQSLSEESEEARQCNAVYNTMRRQVLRAHHWNFATKIVTLALLAETPVGYSFAYAKPADSLRLIKILVPGDPENDTIKFESPGNTIVTDQPDACLKYIKDEEDPSLFAEDFVTSLAHRIAAQLAQNIKGNDNSTQLQLANYERTLAQARTTDASEMRTVKQHGRDFLDARV